MSTSKTRVRKSLPLIGPAMIAIVMVILGVRQSISSMTILPHNHTLTQLQLLKPTTSEALDPLIGAEIASIDVQESAAGWSNLGLALMVKAQSMSGNELVLAHARQSMIRSLEMAPANPYVWTRLAIAELEMRVDREAILGDWRMAELTGQNEERLHIPRIELAIQLWPELTDADRLAAFAEIRKLWSINKHDVLETARDPFSANVIRAALAVDLTQLAEFERRVPAR